MPMHALRYLPTHDATEIERSSKIYSTREKVGLLSEPSLPHILCVLLRTTVAQKITSNQAVTNNQVLRNQYLRRQRPSSG